MKNWNWHRILRVVFGVGFAYMAYSENQMIFTIVAIYLLYQAALNIKCFGSIVPNQKCK